MPRKRPGAIRATRQAAGNSIRQWAHEGGPIDRLSPATAAAIRAVEHSSRLNHYTQDWACYNPDLFKEHVAPGRTVGFLRDYRNFLRQPGRKLRPEASECPSCPGCRYVDVAVVRDALEAVTRVLPPPARAEMRRLLTRLDHEFRRRTQPDSSPKAKWTGETLPWWHRRIYRN